MKIEKIKSWILPVIFIALALFLITSRSCFFRLDLTAEKRHSLSPASKNLVKEMREPLKMKLYLGGDLDANMLRLRHAVEDMVDEVNLVAKYRIEIELINPSEELEDEKRYAKYQELEQRGLSGMSVTVRDARGRMTEQVIFPWAEMYTSKITIPIRLMQPSGNYSGEQIVNLALEDIEYQIIDAIRVLNAKDIKKVAFIEGHNELQEEYVYDATEALSRYFQVDRGVLGTDPTILDGYDAIIIAKPTEPFSETDKFIIDQYIMRGGRVMWLIDGARMSNENLSTGGLSPLIAYELNLHDQLFKYGVRITPSIIEDMQCGYMPVNMARAGEQPRFESIPWFYTPLLQPSPINPATKNISAVKADFASGIEVVGDTSSSVKKEFLLISSNASHITFAPAEIDVTKAVTLEPEEYFDRAYIPVAVSMQGSFPSVFTHRMVPTGIDPVDIIQNSVDTKMIVVADGDIIRNEVEVDNQQMYLVPLGYDRVTKQTHGNKDFIVNSMLYLTDDEGVMELRNRTVALRLLNRAVVESKRTQWILINTLVPIALIILLGSVYLFYRHRKYTKIN